MQSLETEDANGRSRPDVAEPALKGISAFFPREALDASHPSLIHFSSTPLFRLERTADKYAHLLKKKDVEFVTPLVNYFISNSDHVVCLAGDAVRNLYLHGKKKKYKALNILAILTTSDVDRYSWIMNNIISSNDGAFSMGLKYKVGKNRKESCFKEIALARYVIEPRLEGVEKLFYLLRCSTIELDLTTQQRFSDAFRVEVR